jgi:hypothetical protein
MAHMTNPLATPDQLFQRRSLGALPMELQDIIFFSAQCLTQAAGLLLQLPQSVTAQANVLLARYWLVDNMMAHEFSVCIWLHHLLSNCHCYPSLKGCVKSPKKHATDAPVFRRTSPPQLST